MYLTLVSLRVHRGSSGNAPSNFFHLQWPGGEFCHPTAWRYPLTSLAGYGESNISRQDETSPEVNLVLSFFFFKVGRLGTLRNKAFALAGA